jgi:hypothetical protein
MGVFGSNFSQAQLSDIIAASQIPFDPDDSHIPVADYGAPPAAGGSYGGGETYG